MTDLTSPGADVAASDSPDSDVTARVHIRGLWVRFGSVAAVQGIDLSAHAGRATALLGRNGAGKSTTMRVLAGVIPPTEGEVVVDGTDVREDPLRVKRLVGYCPDVGGLVPRATPWEHLQLAARLRRMEDWEHGPATCSSASSSATPRTGSPPASATAWAAGSRWCWRRSTSPRCCCSTSPSTASTRSAWRPPSRSSPTPRPGVPRCWSPRTCATWPCRPARTPWCCAVAAPSPPLSADELRGEEGARVYRALLD